VRFRRQHAQRAADVAAGRPDYLLPECVYIAAADRKKLAVVKRKRKSWQ
jgi:hypothetical protein